LCSFKQGTPNDGANVEKLVCCWLKNSVNLFVMSSQVKFDGFLGYLAASKRFINEI